MIGVILVDKIAGPSSAETLNQLKRKLNLDKVGHAGTLDPMASGLLVALVGKGTRLASYAESGEKTYSGVITFGVETDSFDAHGALTSRSTTLPSAEQVYAQIPLFSGELSQMPPALSALKVNGQRAYALARTGQVFELKSRQVTVSDLSLKMLNSNQVSFRLNCSKGFYVRSLARDLGRNLGCGATLTTLRREGSYPYSVDQAKRVEYIEPSDILSCRGLFPGVPLVLVNQPELSGLKSGNTRTLETFGLVRSVESTLALYGPNEHEAAGLLVRTGESWKVGVNF